MQIRNQCKKNQNVASESEQTCALQHLFCHEETNNQSYYDVDFDNSSRILTASLRIAHKRNIVLEVNTYYPYGMLNTSLSWHLTNNQFKYQSKEYLNTLNYNVLDFGARMGACPDRSVGNPAIARFTTPDPIMQFNNGYFAMGGNPVSMIDPSGMKAEKDFQGYDEGPSLTQQPPSGGGGSPVTIDGMPLYGSTPMLEHIMGELMAKGPDGEDNILGYSSSTLSVNIIQKDDKIFTSFNPVYQMVNTINNNYKSKYAHYNINGKDDRESGETDDYFTGYSFEHTNETRINSSILFNDENKAYRFMWNNSKESEVAAILTNKGVLVLPTTNNDLSTSDPYTNSTRKTSKGAWQVKHNQVWLNILGTVHTHPGSSTPYGWGDYRTVYDGWGPGFIITPDIVMVAYYQNGKQKWAEVTSTNNVLYKNWSLFTNIKYVPK